MVESLNEKPVEITRATGFASACNSTNPEFTLAEPVAHVVLSLSGEDKYPTLP